MGWPRVAPVMYRLAAGETTFWPAAGEPDGIAAAQGERCVEFLQRAMLCAPH